MVKKPEAEKQKPVKTHQKRHRIIFENCPAVVCSIDADGTFLSINEGGVKVLGGKSRTELIGKTSILFFHKNPEDWNRLQSIVAQNGYIQEFETRFRRLDKRLMDVRMTVSARRSPKGAISGYEIFILDVTQKKKAENELRQSEEKYRMIVENSLVSISLHQKGLLRYVNQRYCDAMGFKSPAEVLGKPFWFMVHPNDRAAVKELGLKREQGKPSPERYTFRVIKKDKSISWVETRISQVHYMGESVAVVNAFGVTRRKLAEQEIRDLSRQLVKARDQERRKLAADLHDELGQTLTVIHFELDSLHKMIAPQESEQKRRCEKLSQSVERLVDTIRDHTTFLYPQILDQIFLVPALKQYIDEFHVNHPGIQIEFNPLGFKKQLGPEIELAIYRVIQEGLRNVIKHAQATKVEIILTYNHPYVFLTVRDNGAGCPDTNSKIQGQDSARGIGLRGMRERVVSLGGSFEILSMPGKGTMIRVDLPV